MGLIEKVLTLVFGGNGGKAIAETAQVFRVHAENQAERDAKTQAQALEQFAAEFKQAQRGPFDRFMDGLNRVPRPALALGTLGLFVAAMIDPAWFAARMSGIALVPEPLWWLLGVIVSFYFGARHQAKGQEFQRDVVRNMSAVPGVLDNLREIEALRAGAGVSVQASESAATGPSDAGGTESAAPFNADMAHQATQADANPALEDWQQIQAARPATT